MGLSQESVGNAIGVTFQQIQKYERGVNRMGASRIYDFSRILDIPIDYFFEGYGQKLFPAYPGGMGEEAPGFEHEKMSSRETLELMRAYYRITDPAVRKRVFELIKSLADKQEA